MKLYIFGACSGTEPYPATHHCSFALDRAGELTWFDAGECCSHTAYTMGGVDITKTRRILLSHLHTDHIGGLANIFWVLRKLQGRYNAEICSDIDLYLPDVLFWDALLGMMQAAEGGFSPKFAIHPHPVQDGVLLDENGLKITALHTHHLKHEEGTPWRAFGYLIECDGQRIVYSGDTGGVYDYEPLLPADLLIMETGHHHPPEVAKELLDKGIFPGKLAFIHHGRDLLNRREEQVQALNALCPGKYMILHDAQTLEL